MRLVIMSDTHGHHLQMAPLPEGDLLIHAGDLTRHGTLEEVAGFFEWFETRPHRYKVVIAGNHDFAFERQAAAAEALVPANVLYLRDSGANLGGLEVWGSPWQPWLGDWAFNVQRGPEIARKWALIPNSVHVLVTHGPPHGVLDETLSLPSERAGCEALAIRISELRQLQLHAFGHVHEAYGSITQGGRTFVNASICDVDYAPTNHPFIVEL